MRKQARSAVAVRGTAFEETLARIAVDRAAREAFYAEPQNARLIARDEVEAFARTMKERRRREALRFLHHLHAVLDGRELAERFDADAATRPLPSGARRHAADALAFAVAMARLPGKLGEAGRLDGLALSLSARPRPWPSLRVARVRGGVALGWRGFGGDVSVKTIAPLKR